MQVANHDTSMSGASNPPPPALTTRVVSMLFDVGRESDDGRSIACYIEWARATLAQTHHDVTFFVDPELAPVIRGAPRPPGFTTQIVPLPRDLLPTSADIPRVAAFLPPALAAKRARAPGVARTGVGHDWVEHETLDFQNPRYNALVVCKPWLVCLAAAVLPPEATRPDAWTFLDAGASSWLHERAVIRGPMHQVWLRDSLAHDAVLMQARFGLASYGGIKDVVGLGGLGGGGVMAGLCVGPTRAWQRLSAATLAQWRRLIDAGRVTNEQNVWSFLVVSGKAKESGLMPIVGFEDGRAPPHAPPEIQEGCWYPVIYSAFPVVWTPADAPPPVPLTRRRPPCTHADGRDDVMAEKARRQAAVQAAN